MKLFIGNVSSDATDAEVMELLSEFAPVVAFHRPLHRETGLPRRFAFVTLENREKGEAAMAKLNDIEFFGRKLGVSEAEERGGGGNSQVLKWEKRPRNEYGESAENAPSTRRGDDRPVGANGKRVRYKGI